MGNSAQNMGAKNMGAKNMGSMGFGQKEANPNMCWGGRDLNANTR